VSPASAVDPLRTRLLLVLSTRRDLEITRSLLGTHGIAVEPCITTAELQAELQRGAGAVLVAEEMLGHGGVLPVLAHAVEEQPRWSDLPVLVLTKGGADSLEVGDAIALLGNFILLERPMRVGALLSSVHAALRARHRQYEIESHLLQLERARDAEALAARRKDEFLAMLAHELRNPLAPISNALHVLAMGNDDAPRRAQLRDMMMRQVKHMVRLVDDLLEASRLSHGMITLHRDRFDLRDALRAAIEQSRPLIDAGHYCLELVQPREPLPVHADPVRIAQVFGNLLNNATRYGRPGGRIVVEVVREGAYAVIRVDDDGIGIAPEVLPHVFELFVQGTRDSDSVQQGLGIGLALVHRLVELHGGDVSASSDGPGRGARFTVRLPLATPTPVAVPPAAGTGSLQSLRVLVVDDNVDAALSLAMVLETLGIEHAVAHDGATALGMLDTFRPHAALLDIGMRGMDGYELARRIRQLPRHADMLLVAVSGWTHSPDLQRSRDAGIDHHLAKPVDLAQLTALLSQRAREAGAHAAAGKALSAVPHGNAG